MWTDREITADEEQAIAAFMARLAAAPLPAPQQPADAPVLWLKGQLLRRWEAQRRVQAPLDVMEPLEIAVSLAAAVALLVWSLPSLMRLL
jgi:hypothetical protein